MKYRYLKAAMYSASAIVLLTMSGCLKSVPTFVDFSQTNDFVVLANAGISNFKSSNVSVNTSSTDTLLLTVTADLASATSSSAAISVTLAVDNPQIALYNAANGTKFQAFPADAFKLLSNKVTIAGGLQHYASTTIQVYQNKLDPTISYLLPISITDASGKKLSSNQNTVFFNVIGNPISGIYNWDFTRWSNPTQTGPSDGTSFTGKTTSFLPDSPTQIEVASGYYIGPRYVVSFTNTNGTLSDFKVILNPDDVTTMADAGVIVTNGPNIIKANPVTGEYIFQYTTKTRYVIDRYYK